MNVLILDTETTGLDYMRDSAIELGLVLWSSEYLTSLVTYATVIQPPPTHNQHNEAEYINGIPAKMLPELGKHIDASVQLRLRDKIPIMLARQADLIVAHNAKFDRRFCRHIWPELDDMDWVCTLEDFTWPKQAPGGNLSAIALAHGQAVVAAHRAINDCLLLVRLFESIPDVDRRLKAALVYAKEPKVIVRAKVEYRQNYIAKGAGFRYSDGSEMPKGWVKRMTMDEFKQLKASAPIPLELVSK